MGEKHPTMGEKDHRSNELSQPSAELSSLLAISNVMRTGLSPQSLRACLQLIEMGVDPRTLAEVVKELRKTVATANSNKQANSNAPNLPYTRNG